LKLEIKTTALVTIYRLTMAEKVSCGYVTSISVKNFNFDEFYFKIQAGYKNTTQWRKQMRWAY